MDCNARAEIGEIKIGVLNESGKGEIKIEVLNKKGNRRNQECSFI